MIALRAAHRLAAALSATGGELVVLDDVDHQAYAVPGRPGRIVVSSGLLRALTAAERRGVLAHERAHLRHHHHVHHTAAQLAAAATVGAAGPPTGAIPLGPTGKPTGAVPVVAGSTTPDADLGPSWPWLAALAGALEQSGRDAAASIALAEEIVAQIQGAIVLARALNEPAVFARAMTNLRARAAAAG